ncbi:MAG: GNAT family N-acetyltransferase [Alphaproteobacteria bacterium]
MDAEVDIRLVRSHEEIIEAGHLAREFTEFLRQRYPEMANEIDAYLTQQNFDGQLANLPRYFNPPFGECLLARLDQKPVGILMLKRLDERVCEMNRMFVRPKARGYGIGRRLSIRLIDRARELGYVTIALSALGRHYEALPLYRSLGFVDDPDALVDKGNAAKDVVYMRMDIQNCS